MFCASVEEKLEGRKKRRKKQIKRQIIHARVVYDKQVEQSSNDISNEECNEGDGKENTGRGCFL